MAVLGELLRLAPPRCYPGPNNPTVSAPATTTTAKLAAAAVAPHPHISKRVNKTKGKNKSQKSPHSMSGLSPQNSACLGFRHLALLLRLCRKQNHLRWAKFARSPAFASAFAKTKKILTLGPL